MIATPAPMGLLVPLATLQLISVLLTEQGAVQSRATTIMVPTPPLHQPALRRVLRAQARPRTVSPV